MHDRLSLAGKIDHGKRKAFYQHAPGAANTWLTVQGKLCLSSECSGGRPAKAAAQARAYRFVIGNLLDELLPRGSA